VGEEALAADSADAVEELLARQFAPRFYDLLTGSGEPLPPAAT
jgi:hypothetical protein